MIMINRIVWTLVSAHIQTTNSIVQEACVVTSRAQHSYLTIALYGPCIVERFVWACGPQNFLHGVCCDGAEFRSGRKARSFPGDSHIDVEISYRGPREPCNVFFHPFRASNKAIFFRIPRAELRSTISNDPQSQNAKKRSESLKEELTTMVLLGFQPVASSFPKALLNSTVIALPECGSAAPPTIQASL